MNKLLNSARSFLKDEEGAQVIEYALIIAVVSITLVLAISLLAGPPSPFTAFIARVTGCLQGIATCS
ncbi:Flp family type IVb pilin [Variovorax guangxiensis]|uniref:Flp family type IVb pilin n=1 Tax=Variovorax guangxiensis TaxID=1775474 RepID=UPI0028637A33|nr:Flp family type IVb pilin [Variovorax guangxiensis]MDR6857400.1 pilus assembly protein Flp/PilA [Variovorax guangxiensis]